MILLIAFSMAVEKVRVRNPLTMARPGWTPSQSKRAPPAARCKIPVVDPKLPVFVPNLTREIDLVGHYRFVALGDHLGASKFASEI